MNDWVMDEVRMSRAQFERVTAQLRTELQIAEARSESKLARQAGLDRVFRAQAEAIKAMIAAANAMIAAADSVLDCTEEASGG
jgi:mitochondrial fission protein ELM1